MDPLLTQTYVHAPHGDFDTVTGQGIAGALDAWIDARIAAGVLDPTARSRASLRAEALAALVGAGDRAEPGAHQGRARVAITWDAADLLGQPVTDLAGACQVVCVRSGSHG